MRQPARDLFGEIPVTAVEVAAWLIAVPKIDPGSPRAAAYVRAYAVPEKIAAAKEAGTFEQITALREPPPGHWWRRFRWG